MSADSQRTSLFTLTEDQHSDLGIERIEIPHFQRDYAQGRDSDRVRRIRTDFLDALFSAIAGDESTSIGLDFVYGGVEDGTLRPLDGQQRLTTLFLIHWYFASRSGHLDDEAGWKQFTYATRQSARMFCERLVQHPLENGAAEPAAWVRDQPWYLFLWRHDPTIQSMLVMIDAINGRFHEVDAEMAWSRLTDPVAPAVWFLFQPLAGLGSAGGQDMRPEDLYIKMNSRGKPLTEFESFKAHFEKTIESSSLVADFARRVDTTWSDLLWQLRGDDDLVDDEFMRYMEFITEVCEWRDGRDDGAGQRLGHRTPAVFGEANPRRDEHLDFLFRAFDVWVEHSASETFASYFASSDGAGGETKVRLFFRTGDQSEALNLFEACCRSYGETRGHGKARAFSLGQTLVLYAVVIHLVEGTQEFSRRVRVLRNLIEASIDELRLDNMPKILEDVHRLIRHGDIEAVATLNQAQVQDEKLKVAFLAEHPDLRAELFTLEDHALLRGSLGAFELEAAAFEQRAIAFRELMSQSELWTDLLGALLAIGEYQRRPPTGARPFLFATDSKRHEGAWRDLLTAASRARLQATRQVLAELLDLVASRPGTLEDALAKIRDDFLDGCEKANQLDWRYYMVRYPSMRESGSSTYFAEPDADTERVAMGYSLIMLKAGGKARNGYYRDPYLHAIRRELDEPGLVEDKWFTGYETQPRRLPLIRSGASLRCVPAGLELTPPPMETQAADFAAVCADLDVDLDDLIVAVPQVEVDGRRVDTVDRIQLGADVLERLLAAGL